MRLHRCVRFVALVIAAPGCVDLAPLSSGPADAPNEFRPEPTPPAAEEAPLAAPALDGSSRVVVVDGELFVNGTAFVVRGVTYAPVPAGWRNGLGWVHVPEIYETDLPLLRAMGANTLRLVTAPSDAESGRRFLDAASANGLHVILGIPGPMREDASDPVVREATLRAVREVVTLWMDHPAVLMWIFGNEVNYQYGGDDVADWYALLEECAALARSLDPRHPVGTANSGFENASAFEEHAPSVDVFGINHYNYEVGHYAWYVNETARRLPGKAILVTEVGSDALDVTTGREYEDVQAKLLVEHVRAIEGADRSIGTVVFEWVDEWWKSRNGSRFEQDKTPDWVPWGALARLPDGSASEEWFGLVRQREGTTERTPREAYHALARLWGGEGWPASS